MNAEDIKQLLTKNKAALAKEFGLETLGIFGSVAENKQREDSDIDLFYGLQEGRFLNLRQLDAFEQKVKKILKRQEVDLVNLRQMNPIVRYRAEKHFIYV